MPGIDANAGSWTSAQLLTDVRQKARIPAGTLDYTDTTLLEEATRQLWEFGGWAMSKASDGRLLQMLQRPSAANFNSIYAPGRDCFLPFDAAGDTFDAVFWVAQGVETRLEPIDLYSQPLYDSPTATGTPWGFAVVDGLVRLYPKPNVTGNVRFAYQKRLPRIVPIASIGIVTGPNTVGASSVQLTISGAPGVTVDTYFDVINAASPYRYIMSNALCTAVAGLVYTTTTYNSANFSIPLTLSNMANLVQSGTSQFVHLPLEFKSCFTEKVAAQVLYEIGDQQGGAVMEQKAEASLGRVVQMLNPRSQAARTKVVNPYSLMRSRRLRGVW